MRHRGRLRTGIILVFDLKRNWENVDYPIRCWNRDLLDGCEQLKLSQSDEAGSALSRRLLGASGSLQRKSTTAVLWLWSGGLLRGVIGMVLTGILARKLGATPYGIFAVINAIVMFSIQLADSGIGVALIQRESIASHEIRSCHTYAFLQGIAVGMLMALLAVPAGLILHDRELVLPLIVSSISIPLATWGTTSLALLRRDIRHKEAQWCQFGAYTASQLLITLPLAVAGQGVGALVWGLLGQWGIQSASMWMVTRHDVRPHFKRDQLSIRFTWSIMAQNLSIWTLAQIDQLILSKVGSPYEVGLYNRAKWATEAPNMYVVGAVQSVVLSAASRSQRDAKKIKSLIIKALCLSFVSGGVILAISVAFPGAIVHLLLGKKFTDAVVFLPILAGERLLWCLFTPIGQTLNGLGRPELEAKSMLALIPIACVCYTLAAHWGGAKGVAWAVAGMAALRLVTQGWLLFKVYKAMPKVQVSA